jgi:hypothetical protein
MCYRCQVCAEVVRHNMPQKRHIIYRKVNNPITGITRTEIAQELPVCNTCYNKLGTGEPVKVKVIDRQLKSILKEVNQKFVNYTNYEGKFDKQGNKHKYHQPPKSKVKDSKVESSPKVEPTPKSMEPTKPAYNGKSYYKGNKSN